MRRQQGLGCGPSRSSLMIACCLLLSATMAVGLSQSTYEPICQIVNLNLTLDQTYHRPLIMVASAPYCVVSSIHPSNSSIVEPIVIISLVWDEGSREIYHRGDSPHQNITFVPVKESHSLTIANNGQIQMVSVNLTIVQVGPPTAPSSPNDSSLRSLFFAALVATVLGPPIVLALSTQYLGRRRSSAQDSL
jgi:hypothetical protein